MRLKDFFTYDLWRSANSQMSRGKKFGYSILKTIVLVARNFGDKQLNIRANALTYSLMFAIVPILAMVLAIAKGFGFDAIIQEKLNSSFLAETNIIPIIMEFVDRYLNTAQGGAFIGIGLLILIVAVYLFFRKVEVSFNDVWNVKQSRSILRQLTTYIAILFLIPVLIIVTSGLSVFLQSASTSIEQLAFLNHFKAGFIRFFQFAMVWIVFTLMYKGIPNTQVKLFSALIPGIIIGSLFQVLQMLSVTLIVWLGRTSIVYGAFATIPILLIFLQVICLMILIGAEMSFAIQNKEEFEYKQDLETISRQYKDYLMLYILSIIIRRFNHDETPLTHYEIANQEQLPLRLVSQLASRLLQTGLIREIWVEDKETPALQPAFDTHDITLKEVMERIDKQGSADFITNDNKELKTFWEHYIQLRTETHQCNNILISDI